MLESIQNRGNSNSLIKKRGLTDKRGVITYENTKLEYIRAADNLIHFSRKTLPLSSSRRDVASQVFNFCFFDFLCERNKLTVNRVRSHGGTHFSAVRSVNMLPSSTQHDVAITIDKKPHRGMLSRIITVVMDLRPEDRQEVTCV